MGYGNGSVGRVGLFVASVMLAQLFVGAPAHAGTSECSADNPELETLNVELQSEESSYRVGKVARVTAYVERDLTVSSPPAEGAKVVVGLHVKKAWVFGSGVTDATGVAHVKVRLKRYLSPGMADGSASATVEYGQEPCFVVREWDYTEVDDLFRVRPARAE